MDAQACHGAARALDIAAQACLGAATALEIPARYLVLKRHKDCCRSIQSCCSKDLLGATGPCSTKLCSALPAHGYARDHISTSKKAMKHVNNCGKRWEIMQQHFKDIRSMHFENYDRK